MRTVAQLQKGEKGIVKNFTDEYLSLKLLEMGVLPGAEVEYMFTAPFGCPMCIKVFGYHLSLRKDEAVTIVLA